MRLSIRHRTCYRYEHPALRVTQALRLWPAASDAQKVLGWRVDIDGERLAYATTDSFGNPVATHTADGAIDQVQVDVRGEVETADHQGIVAGTVELLPARFFLYETPLTIVDASIREFAAGSPPGTGDLDRLHQLCNRVRDRVDYLPGQTDVETTAAEALAHGAGVCQDHAHLLVAVARALGYPARYVSGYLCAGADSGAAASHAWAEIHVADIGWVGFDAANRICPNEYYVRIACGRDYRDAAPVRGVHQGGKSESLEVSVSISEVERIDPRSRAARQRAGDHGQQ
jgi:transglutaminase-like putative cysteine protease